MHLTPAHLIALSHVSDIGADLRKISEPHRQKIIDLGMMEPPLIAVDADKVFVTDAGRAVLRNVAAPGAEEDGR
jgi:hypothetical protein